VPRDPDHRLATLARDGWALVDVERAFLARDGVYWVPPTAERRAPAPGSLVKLLFAWADPGRPEDPGRERLWVEVVAHEGGLLAGRLVEEPDADAPIAPGAEVCFRPEHVADVVVPGHMPLSERSGLVRCAEGHGWSEPAFVCAHLAGGTELGFHVSGDPAAFRPEAWCDRCARAVEEAASGGAPAPPPNVVRVCGGCWDRVRDRNRREPR
jgi:hypothetical protein